MSAKLEVDAYTGAVIEDPPRVMLYLHPDDPLPAPGTQYRVTFHPEQAEPVRRRSRKNSQAAAILCKDRVFHAYIRDQLHDAWMTDNDEDRARRVVIRFCCVQSRSDLDDDAAAAKLFVALEQSFHKWLSQRQDSHSKEDRAPADPGSIQL